MYFKIEKSGCSVRKGLVQVRYDLFLDEEDNGYSKHYVQVPVIPKEGYGGKMGIMGEILDKQDYDAWLASLPKVWQNNPFCCHFCQFESTVTDEEILFVGELTLDMTYDNWVKNDLSTIINQPVTFVESPQKNYDCLIRLQEIAETNFTAIFTIGNYRIR